MGSRAFAVTQLLQLRPHPTKCGRPYRELLRSGGIYPAGRQVPAVREPPGPGSDQPGVLVSTYLRTEFRLAEYPGQCKSGPVCPRASHRQCQRQAELQCLRHRSGLGAVRQGRFLGTAAGQPEDRHPVHDLHRFNDGSRNYDGFGRNAGDNNTLFLYAWLAF